MRLATVILIFTCLPQAIVAQTQYHQPLNQRTPPGQSAGWMNAIRGYNSAWLQPIRIEVEGGGVVESFVGPGTLSEPAVSPASFAANAGFLYRFRVTDNDGGQASAIYPTIELLDRLHPPQGREDEFPIPIILHKEDLELARRGQMVTRVIYLEQPQFAQQMDPLRREIAQTIRPNENLLRRADELGRPMAILRIGGRAPSPNSPPGFFGNGGTIVARPTVTTDASTVSIRRP